MGLFDELGIDYGFFEYDDFDEIDIQSYLVVFIFDKHGDFMEINNYA